MLIDVPAPVSPAVSYDTVVFSSGFGIEKSPFQGQPTEVNDRLWQDLYDCESPTQPGEALTDHF